MPEQQNNMESQKQKGSQNLSAGTVDKNQKKAKSKVDTEDVDKDEDSCGTGSCGTGACE